MFVECCRVLSWSRGTRSCSVRKLPPPRGCVPQTSINFYSTSCSFGRQPLTRTHTPTVPIITHNKRDTTYTQSRSCLLQRQTRSRETGELMGRFLAEPASEKQTSVIGQLAECWSFPTGHCSFRMTWSEQFSLMSLRDIFR